MDTLSPPAPVASGVAAAAIHHDGSARADALLAEAVAALQGQGLRVRGLLMEHVGELVGDTACAAQMFMVDVSTQERYLVSQAMGSLSKACRADPQGFARATVVLRRALAERADLVVLNRFGRLEAEGTGMSAELLDLMAEGVPLLTVVTPACRDAWDRFSGGAPVLPPDEAAVRNWLDAQLPSTARQPA